MFDKNQSLRIKANEDLSSLRDNYVVAPAYNAYNDIVFFVKIITIIIIFTPMRKSFYINYIKTSSEAKAF